QRTVETEHPQPADEVAAFTGKAWTEAIGNFGLRARIVKESSRGGEFMMDIPHARLQGDSLHSPHVNRLNRRGQSGGPIWVGAQHTSVRRGIRRFPNQTVRA